MVSDIVVRTINGTAKDALDYTEHEKTGLTAIAIGGDKLSRGLTLEGLCVSYFLRASRMYDTLMQMGRWFGYRPGYVDLCRLYTTSDLTEWFGHITDAADELREEFDQMAAARGDATGLRAEGPVASGADGNVAPEDADRTEPHAVLQWHSRGDRGALSDKAGA